MSSVSLCRLHGPKILTCLPTWRSLTIKQPSASFFSHNYEWPRRSNISASSLHVPLRRITSAKQCPSTRQELSRLSVPQAFRLYAQLSKLRLSIPIILSAMSGVALSPLPVTLSTLLSTAIGTALCTASANTLNQLQEAPFDAQMIRTRIRPLVRRAITPLHASAFAITTGIGGPLLLWTFVNPTTAILGAANIVLYAGLYTWLKRKGVSNTWVGAVVGAVPPLMGWTAGGGHLISSADHPMQFFLPFTSNANVPVDLATVDNPLAPMALFMLLFSWQFPHFNSLSHVVRGSYAQAGYRMLSSLSPSHNALVAARHSFFLVPICSMIIPLSGLTTWTFALSTLVPNAIFARATWKFWHNRSEKNAKNVFQHSLWYLPVVLALMMAHKQGMGWLEWMRSQGQDVNKGKVSTAS